MLTAIPCKRPKVTVDPRFSLSGYTATCHVPGCGWTYPPATSSGIALISDAHEQARHHRSEHRRAVPASRVYQLPPDGVFNRGYMAECDCGWHRDGPGVTSRADNEAALAYHLSTEHGLVN